MDITRTTIRALLTTTILGVLLLTTACGSETAPTTSSEPELTVEELFAGVGDSLESFSTAKFRMIDELESGTKFFGTTLKNVDGEVQSPDRARMTVEVESPAMGFAEIEIVAGSEEAYVKLFAGASWNPLPLEEVPFNFIGLGSTLSGLLPYVDDPTIVGREALGDAQTVRVEGRLVSEDLTSLITSADPGYEIDLTLWIDQTDYSLWQLRIAGQIFDDDGPETSRLIILSDYDAPVEIQLPDASS